MFDLFFQLRGLGKLPVQFDHKASHLFLEGFAVVFDFLGADVAAGREHIAVLFDQVEVGGFAEAGDVGIGCLPFDKLRANGSWVAAPRMVSAAAPRRSWHCPWAARRMPAHVVIHAMPA